MQRQHDTWLYSPSDLIKFLENEAITWFDRYHQERPGELVPGEDSAEDQLIATAGEKHEGRVLQQFVVEGRDVADLQDVEGRFSSTLVAMREGREIIYQARLECGNFAGYADFLVRADGQSALGYWHYEVWDSKLARGLKPHFAVQLCCYAEMLESIQGRRPENLWVVLGNGGREKLRTDEYFFCYREVKQAFLTQQQTFNLDEKLILTLLADK